MNGLQNVSNAQARRRTPRVSPDLNEFLHVLDALEGQFNDADVKPVKPA